jgi:hypothetical protein
MWANRGRATGAGNRGHIQINVEPRDTGHRNRFRVENILTAPAGAAHLGPDRGRERFESLVGGRIDVDLLQSLALLYSVPSQLAQSRDLHAGEPAFSDWLRASRKLRIPAVRIGNQGAVIGKRMALPKSQGQHGDAHRAGANG